MIEDVSSSEVVGNEAFPSSILRRGKNEFLQWRESHRKVPPDTCVPRTWFLRTQKHFYLQHLHVFSELTASCGKVFNSIRTIFLCVVIFSVLFSPATQTLFEPFFIAVYNVFYTSQPVLALGVFDQDVGTEYSSKYPQLYYPGLHSSLFNKKEFFKSAVQGFLASCVLFFAAQGEYRDHGCASTRRENGTRVAH